MKLSRFLILLVIFCLVSDSVVGFRFSWGKKGGKKNNKKNNNKLDLAGIAGRALGGLMSGSAEER